MIRFEHIRKQYKENVVLNDISFEVQQGELVVLIGESGCGKTTTLKMINRLITPTAGTIFLQGKDIAQMNVIELRRNIGYVIQQTGLFPHMTIKENIEIIPKVSKRKPEEIAARTTQLMEMIGMNPDQFLNRYPTELSGGQQQRIGVARAFALDPDVILMDEPFSALDPITRATLQEELVELQTKLKKTIVFVTHDMGEAIKIADRICIMNDGKIIQYDTPEEVLKHPINDFVASFVGKNRIWSSPEYIKVNDIMIEDPITTQRHATLFQALEKMREARVDSLLVIEPRSRKFLGIIKAKQIRLEADRSQKVELLMKTDCISTTPNVSIVEALKLINEHQQSPLPVLQDGKVVGLITKGSLVTTLSTPYLAVKGDDLA
ncbi:MAG: ABC transporter ATP-binding protein [Bacilli bacterium]